jgi:N-acyl-D-aspartate/D-glutamate deacylase
MRRRSFLRVAASTAAASWLPLRRGAAFRSLEPDLRLVLRGGRWHDGAAWRGDDIGVDAAGRIRLGFGLDGREALALEGRIVSPGFIDVLADNSDDPARTFPIFEKYKLGDGVTTALQMHGGSAACAGYYRELSAAPHRINWGASTSVMRVRGRVQDLSARRALVERNLAEGALGVSHSLEYQPTPYAETLAYARLAAQYERPFFLHLRYSSPERELAGVAEAIRLARESGAHVHIDHLHSTGGTWHMAEALDLIRSAIAGGARLTTCVYPYSYWATYLYSRRFDPGWQRRFGLDYADLRVVGTGERLTAASFARYRKTGVLVAVPEGTMPFERTLDLALAEEFCLIGSDGGIQSEPRANSHPRGAGCFATAIRHGLDRGMPLERILGKMTTLPRRVLGGPLAGRGEIAEGALADLTVFDPAAIRGNATLEDPNRMSSGIALVLVGGRRAFEPGQTGEANGTAIRC